jgi:hypothetical protein
MLLYDDKNNDVLNKVKLGKVLYDFDMNMNGGHIKGTYIQNAQEIISAFKNLTDEKNCLKKYGSSERLMFAVGDGNHSLATAKTCWNNIKANLTDEQKANHPARFALVEVVNIYDPALNFEPIHRLVKTDKAEKFIKNLNLSGKATATVVTEKTEKTISFPEDTPQGIRQLDEYISNFIKENGGEVDYIHGDDEVKSFADQGVAIILPAISKDDFFRLIISGGNLPRKTFSMGEGNEKRYYIEAKRIV